MAKVNRFLVHDGDIYCIECAVRDDGVTSPVAEFLGALRNQSWESEIDSSDQPKTYQWLLAKMEYFADNGEFPHIGNWNQLMKGIWEIKRWSIRVTFFDTDGKGHYTPKIEEKIITGGGGYCPLPNFDPYIRLGTVFEKRTRLTPQHELDLAYMIREEDLEHDRTR
jgi:hypothetical protein